MSLPGPIPAIDVTEADRRLRDDPERPVLLDVRELDEFRLSGRRARCTSRCRRSRHASATCPTDRP